MSDDLGKSTKVVIFGCDGMLGHECFATFSRDFDVVRLSRHDCDITDIANVERSLCEIRPDLVINCAGMIDLAACEKNPELAFRVNAEGPQNIARAIKAHLSHAIFLQFSTCYVFGMRNVATMKWIFRIH
jgi:dTDP-4-dehydrorhamnose reductase